MRHENLVLRNEWIKVELPLRKISSSSFKGVIPRGAVLPYLGYTGTCRWTGHGFLASLS